MARRYLLCAVWALGGAVSFFVLTQVAIASYVYFHLKGVVDEASAAQQATYYVEAHVEILRGLGLTALVLGAVLGATGAWRGKLPGTRPSA